jgi:hypothetical protein
MSHHYSGLNFGAPRVDERLDFTDIYALPKPGDADKSVLIMNQHSSATSIHPEATIAEPFSADGLYELTIDTNADPVADIAYRVSVFSSPAGTQLATVRWIECTLCSRDGGPWGARLSERTRFDGPRRANPSGRLSLFRVVAKRTFFPSIRSVLRAISSLRVLIFSCARMCAAPYWKCAIRP